MEKKSKKVLELTDVIINNNYIDKKVVEEVYKLREEAKKFGHEVKSGYNLTPPLGNQILLARSK
ncbi:MAG: hypothetical protein A2X61_09275 [Ignavibacteria bacterium GWB2_35_12]|nr:MAG: hypothetical protein A2X63_02850 [Ignavibacteria bacterium GWA2_35_8]OGU38169.1 MAG: hypothetical protein A2X61_09275 [Ignavibacteria bacterium GWB2_35_12]OGU94336.1 MAG: hypothetical protein A2220_14315 [Ignavibacteria bacterium RIFOXYA2_FULL_35_10]OGV20026.1 MAG: hypothetical protein A2475_03000 [Ignavibacteria bacterium RIFOXYC2_FULL_35_21]